MINLGGPHVRQLDDGWTIVTGDGSLSAQFEHTVLVTRNGCEILTLPPASSAVGGSIALDGGNAAGT
jgi:methionyl aminopeptidase